LPNWISFFERQPKHGETIFYYGQPIGVWMGRYEYRGDDPVSPHTMISDGGVVDRMDAPWWTQYQDGMEKPEKPDTDYPTDYPK
jgi:hypothetical protein